MKTDIYELNQHLHKICEGLVLGSLKQVLG